jgi:hypothetical protein
MLKRENITIGDIDKEVDKSIDSADGFRAEQLQSFQTVRATKASIQRRESARLTRKYGENHSRVVALTNKRAVNQGIIREVVQERERATVTPPAVDNKTWAVYGFVRDSEDKGVPNLTVAIYDQKGKWIRAFGFACTGANGSFRLETSNLQDRVREQVKLRVLRAGRSLHSDARPLTPTPGRADYREIKLSDGDSVCSPPEEPDDDAPPQPGPDDTKPSPYRWIVRGQITDEEGRGLSGLTVSVYDKDFFFDDLLGQTVTNEEGNYSFTYYADDFRDLIESNPDIYLKVMDNQGNLLRSTEEAVRYEAGKIETINLKVKR